MSTASAIIRRINQQEAKKSLAPYNKPMHAKGPRIVDDTEGAVVIFDGWQNLPPQNLDANEALERAFTRAISIQKRQIMNRVTFYHPRLQETMIMTKIVDPFELREAEEKKARALARQTLIRDDRDEFEDDDDD